MRETFCLRSPVGLLVALGLLAIATLGSHQAAGQTGLPKSFVLPPGNYKPAHFAVCAAGDTIVFSSAKNRDFRNQAVFIFDLRTAKLRDVFRGWVLDIVAAPTPHVFALVIAEGDGSRLLLLHDSGVIKGKVSHPTGWYFVPDWSPDGNYVAFTMNRADVTEDSPDYREFVFTAVGILDVNTFSIRSFALENPGYYMHMAGFDGNIYVSNQLNENEGKLTVTVYDLTGRVVASKRRLRGINFSPNGRYYLPYLYEGALPFEIYDAKTNRPLRVFPGLDTETGEYHVYGRWNPKNDDLLILDHRVERYTLESQHLEVYSVSQGKVLKSFPMFPHAWSPDGKALVVFRDGKFVFESVVP